MNYVNFMKILNCTLRDGCSYAYAARAGYSQNEMMDLIQKRRLDPGIGVKAILTTKQNLKRIKFTNIKNLKLKKSTSSIPMLIGGAPSLKNFGNQLLKKIINKVPIILSGSNVLFNFISIKIISDNLVINPLMLAGSLLIKSGLKKCI